MTSTTTDNAQSPVGGIYPMLYAFYDRHGDLDRDAMRAQVDFCLAAGAHGIACLGLGTEVAALSVQERTDVMAWAAQDIAGKVPLAVTIAGKSVAEQIAQSKSAETQGADWLVLQPPLGEQPDEPELADFYSQVMTQTSLPTGIQNAPEYLGVGLSPAAVANLADRHENFTVMKGEGPVSQIRKYIAATDGKVAIFNGRGGLELPDNLRAGCAGMVPSCDSVDAQVKIYELMQAGRIDEAYKLYGDILPLIVFIMQSLDTFWCYGKLLAARRIGLPGPVTSRTTTMVADEFGLASLDRFASILKTTGKA